MKDIEITNNIVQSSISEVLHDSMIPYAEYVIMDRALPRVEDGLKPVQRRILYSMYELGLTPDKPHKKCARIVGECLGKYHPHGDTSVYDALVRMAQNFNMRMTLVNGHGNFGSVDGDGAAAMRYTEARLEPLAMEMLRDLDKNTVNFNLNFDDSLKEPATLPGRFPNLLVNGATGIAVGIATNIPTHNLGEVISGVCEYIDNPRIKLAEMMKIIKAPDFPTGGYILADEELERAYSTGKGKITLRAKIVIEKEGEKTLLVIKELPYQVNKQNLLRKIADMKEDKKDDILSYISDIADESDRNGMRAVIKLKKDANVEKMLAYLYKNTDLQTTFGINMYVIAEGKPQLLGLLDIIKYYVEYQRSVVLRRTKFDLAAAEARAHILEGLIIAVKNIDEVIRIIKTADNTNDAKQKLRERFKLSNEQAQAILDLRLARLTKLEVFNLKEELAALKIKIKEYKEIIGSKSLQMEVVKNELNDIKRRYKDERRSTILKGGKEIKIEKMVDEEQTANYVLGYSLSKTIKKIPEKNYNMSDRSVGERTVDSDILTVKARVTTKGTVLAFTDQGNCYKIDLSRIPETRYKEKGVKFPSVVGGITNEEPIAFFAMDSIPKGAYLLFLTKDGMIKKTPAEEYNLGKQNFQAIKLKEGDFLTAVQIYSEGTTVCFVTEQGLCLNALLDDVPEQGRISGGVKGIKLNDGDRLIFASQIEDAGEVIVATNKNTFKRVISGLLEPSARYRKGVKICDLPSDGKVIFASFVQEPYKLYLREQSGVFLEIDTEDIVIEPRTSKGKPLKEHRRAEIADVYAGKEV